jgi:hypothetical protein
VVQFAAVDVGRTAEEIRKARAGSDPDQARYTGGTGVVFAADGIVVFQGAVADRDLGCPFPVTVRSLICLGHSECPLARCGNPVTAWHPPGW